MYFIYELMFKIAYFEHPSEGGKAAAEATKESSSTAHTLHRKLEGRRRLGLYFMIQSFL